MSVAYDAATSKVITTGDSTWSHTAAASGVKGVVVYIVVNATTTNPIGVTYGTVAMTKAASAADTITELGNCTAWFLGSGIPQGTQTVDVNVGAGDAWSGACISVTGTGDTTYYYGLAQENQTNPNPTVDQPTAIPSGAIGYPSAGIFSGLQAPTNLTPGTGYTEILEQDFTDQLAGFQRYTTGTTTGPISVLYTMGSDDCAMVALVIVEPTENPPPILVMPRF